jgi:hypothetical protein
MTMTSRPGRRRRVRSIRRLVGLGMAAALTIGLAQNTTTAAFSGQTVDTGNRASTAATFCTTPGTTAPPLNVALDAAAYEVQPGNNYSATPIGVGTGATGDAYTYLKFPRAPVPPRCTVTAATLHVYARTPTAPATIDVYRAGGPWDNTLTWNSPRPGWAGTAVSTAVSASAGWLQWTVTTLTQELYAGTDYGFLLKDSVDHHPTVTRYQTWESRESDLTKAAYLVVSWG